MTKDEAMKLALEALENSIDLVSHEARNAEELYGKYPSRLARIQGLVAFEVAHEKAITALREALAEQPVQQEYTSFAEWANDYVRANLHKLKPAQQEPVARVFNKSISWRPCDIAGLPAGTPLYTSPPAQRTWVGLTDEEREQHRNDWHSNIHDKEFRAIEAKLKEKNT